MGGWVTSLTKSWFYPTSSSICSILLSVSLRALVPTQQLEKHLSLFWFFVMKVEVPVFCFFCTLTVQLQLFKEPMGVSPRPPQLPSLQHFPGPDRQQRDSVDCNTAIAPSLPMLTVLSTPLQEFRKHCHRVQPCLCFPFALLWVAWQHVTGPFAHPPPKGCQHCKGWGRKWWGFRVHHYGIP